MTKKRTPGRCYQAVMSGPKKTFKETYQTKKGQIKNRYKKIAPPPTVVLFIQHKKAA